MRYGLMTIDEIRDRLGVVLSPKRFKHSLGVMETAVKLAELNGFDVKRAELAGILHDCAREFKNEEIIKICKENNIEIDDICGLEPKILHGPVGAVIAKNEYGINDEEILGAICCHTTGRKNMTVLDKIIFLADYIEPGRDFPGVDKIRKAVYEDLDTGMVVSLVNTIKHLAKKRQLIQKDTIDTWNYIMMKMK